MRATLALALTALPFLASADDGGIALGGNPGLLNGHPTVSMESERVKMDIGEQVVTVACKFVFLNDGPTCTVRVGFPDMGIGFLERGGSCFTSFKSWVDGKPVPTKYVKGDNRNPGWQAKMVTFKAQGRTVVEDLYVSPIGGSATSYAGREGVHTAMYILHTGSSWKGPIGAAHVEVTFPKALAPPPLAVTDKQPNWQEMKEKGSWPYGPHMILYGGFAKPKIQGQTLVFDRKDFKPTFNDDLNFAFGVVRPGK